MTLAVHLRCCGHPPGTFDQQQLLLSGERGCISDRWDPVELFFFWIIRMLRLLEPGGLLSDESSIHLSGGNGPGRRETT